MVTFISIINMVRAATMSALMLGLYPITLALCRPFWLGMGTQTHHPLVSVQHMIYIYNIVAQFFILSRACTSHCLFSHSRATFPPSCTGFCVVSGHIHRHIYYCARMIAVCRFERCHYTTQTRDTQRHSEESTERLIVSYFALLIAGECILLSDIFYTDTHAKCVHYISYSKSHTQTNTSEDHPRLGYSFDLLIYVIVCRDCVCWHGKCVSNPPTQCRQQYSASTVQIQFMFANVYIY